MGNTLMRQGKTVSKKRTASAVIATGQRGSIRIGSLCWFTVPLLLNTKVC